MLCSLHRITTLPTRGGAFLLGSPWDLHPSPHRPSSPARSDRSVSHSSISSAGRTPGRPAAPVRGKQTYRSANSRVQNSTQRLQLLDSYGGTAPLGQRPTEAGHSNALVVRERRVAGQGRRGRLQIRADA